MFAKIHYFCSLFNIIKIITYICSVKNNEMDLLGKLVRDRITNYEGIAITKLIALFGCIQYGVAGTVKPGEKRGDTEYFDEGRLEVIGAGFNAEDVSVEKPGADFNFDAPRK